MKMYNIRQLVSKNIIVLSLGLVSLLAIVSSAAAGTPNIAVVDAVVFQQRLLTEVNDSLEKEFKTKQAEIQKSIEKFNKDKETLKKDEKIMTADKLKKLQNSLAQQQAELQKTVKTYEEEVNAKRQDALKAKLDVLMQVVQDISTENKYDMVLAKNIALYIDPKYDITEQVSSKYDQVSKGKK